MIRLGHTFSKEGISLSLSQFTVQQYVVLHYTFYHTYSLPKRGMEMYII